MKKFIAITLLAVAIIVAMCGCSNRSIVDLQYEFDYALVRFPDGSTETIEIKRWADYDGEQIQIIADDGTVYVFCSANCVLVKEEK